jgi:PiT family inorganic phosphate transporter
MGPEVFLWVTVAVGLYMAWTIGANDVANAMGTSVGSKALTFKQAVLVAAIFEFAGAVLAGGTVTDTVRKGIVDPAAFGDPMQLIVGMTCALLAAAIWLHLATFYGWPVSTTHSIVGAVAGFGAVSAGISAINGAKLGLIVASWVISPLMGAVIAFGVFLFVRQRILEVELPVRALKRLGPVLLFPVFVILTLSFVFKGLKNLNLHLSFSEALSYGLLVGAVASAVSWLLLRRVDVPESGGTRTQLFVVERNFGYLQILTACYVAFAHGSNDVANAVGPMAAVYGAIKEGVVGGPVGVPIWILLIGGVGIVLGLATYGHKVMSTIGRDITEMTPSRGFCAEFGAATTILIGSKMGLPISTTHTLVGAVIGVGFARGVAALDFGILRRIVASWVITVPFSALLSAVLYLIAAFSLGIL